MKIRAAALNSKSKPDTGRSSKRIPKKSREYGTKNKFCERVQKE
jgi:hypothetical protein